jgi:protein SPT2
VKNALDKIEEQESSTHRKRRTNNKPIMLKEKDDDLLKVDKSRNNDRDVQKKVRPKGLPPEAALSFDQILKLAAAKQHEPIKLEKKLDLPEKKEPESNRLMTKKEKEDLMRRKEEERERQLRKEGKLPPITPDNAASAVPAKSKEKPPTKLIASKEPVKAPSLMNGKTLNPGPNTSLMATKPNVRADDQKSLAVKPNNAQRPGVSKLVQNKQGPPQMKSQPSKTLPPSQLSRVPQGKGKSLAKPPVGASRPFPPYRDIRPVERAYKSIKLNMFSVKLYFNIYLIIKGSMESDEEEDSELDDFIDDGPDEAEDYSKHIQDIFGYNRNR